MEKRLKRIGIIKTPYHTLSECPNNIAEDGPMCEIVLDKKYAKGLLGLTDAHSIMLLYWLGSADKAVKMQVHSHMDKKSLRGIFSLRTPKRPNPIGVALVKNIKIEGNSIFVKGLDCLDGTFLIDIKPAIKQEVFEITH